MISTGKVFAQKPAKNWNEQQQKTKTKLKETFILITLLIDNNHL